MQAIQLRLGMRYTTGLIAGATPVSPTRSPHALEATLFTSKNIMATGFGREFASRHTLTVSQFILRIA
jgi:hypothetical protein